MSQLLISRSEDLTRLRNEGYDIEIRAGHLVVKHVPYVDQGGTVRLGTLACVLDNDGTMATPPSDHTILFAGEFPCTAKGARLDAIVVDSNPVVIDGQLTTQHRFSSKPPESGRYPNFYEKIHTYANQLSGHAEAIDPTVTPRPFLPVVAAEDEGPFVYVDTASARAGISAISKKLELSRVAIVGLGGTGSYVFDQVAKTPVNEIHLFDADVFSSHNAFRAPGAASLAELGERPSKADYWAQKYAPFRRGVVPHGYVTAENLNELAGMDFVFLCLDGNRVKRSIVEWLERERIPFTDVGMGLFQVDGAIAGTLRLTTSTPDQPAQNRIPFSDDDLEDVYATNIQVADLNALNAVLAVIKWKKLFGFYVDLEQETNTFYAVDGNQLTNENDGD